MSDRYIVRVIENGKTWHCIGEKKDGGFDVRFVTEDEYTEALKAEQERKGSVDVKA